MTDQIYLTPKELLDRWRGAVSHVQTLANWRNQGRGPEYVKLEHKVLYPPVAATFFATILQTNTPAVPVLWHRKVCPAMQTLPQSWVKGFPARGANTIKGLEEN